MLGTRGPQDGTVATDTYVECDLGEFLGARLPAGRASASARWRSSANSRLLTTRVRRRHGRCSRTCSSGSATTGFDLVRDSGSGAVVLATREVTRPRGGQETVSTDLGYATIEVTTPATGTLFAAQRRLDRILRLIIASCAANDCLVLGYGMQPITPPSRELVTRSSRYLMYERFSQHRILPGDVGADIHLFTISAATHCHIDVALPEAVRAANALNALAGVQIALTANSPIWNGRIDPEWKAPREIFYDRTYHPDRWPSGRPCGVPPAFGDLGDYLEAVLDTWAPLVERDGEPLALSPSGLTAREFMGAASVQACTAGGEDVEVSPEPSDIIAFAHHLEFDARLCPAHGTVESRISCAQPPGAAVQAAAFALGLVENLAAAEGLIARLPLADQKRLRIAGARHGLTRPDTAPRSTSWSRPLCGSPNRACGEGATASSDCSPAAGSASPRAALMQTRTSCCSRPAVSRGCWKRAHIDSVTRLTPSPANCRAPGRPGPCVGDRRARWPSTRGLSCGMRSRRCRTRVKQVTVTVTRMPWNAPC